MAMHNVERFSSWDRMGERQYEWKYRNGYTVQALTLACRKGYYVDDSWPHRVDVSDEEGNPSSLRVVSIMSADSYFDRGVENHLIEIFPVTEEEIVELCLAVADLKRRDSYIPDKKYSGRIRFDDDVTIEDDPNYDPLYDEESYDQYYDDAYDDPYYDQYNDDDEYDEEQE